MNKVIFILLTLFSFSALANSVLSMKERSALIDTILEQRFSDVLPEIMEREGIDMWVLMSREYNEDPVLKTMLPSTWLAARRRTMLVIYNPGDGRPLEKLAVARYAVGSLFEKAWDKEAQPDQWQALKHIIESRNPTKIAINTSDAFALADGMTSTEYNRFMATLSDEFKRRVVSGEMLAIGWLETRSELEMKHYPALAQIGHSLIATAFSNEVITPNVTTTDDVVWWLRDQTRALGLTNWFHPTVSIQRKDSEVFDQISAFSKRPGENIIRPGDLIHVDFGITYLRLNTDQQQHAYVLKPGEKDAPASLKNALKAGNQLQDILTSNFKVGRTGNTILNMSRQQAIEQGITPAIYTHPLGFHGHAAGPTIGMWDAQEGVPIKGDYPMFAQTAYSIELNAASFIEKWNKEIRIMLEEDAFFDGKSVTYLDNRQTEFHLIHSGEAQ
ncbi:Xaa-Pro aminopeptidase family protein [Alteromonas mediterranea U7]|nr:M24 family metallopeptidase [Alteromonas mediterranea]AGP86503.1 Xaa-Pro aminopeptidase family protein [Alteromonas mediterranea U4]AGP90642.1 Xaa-Pro aminopeptidase family protein [Alteromonas mediterranea U7]AGP94459.1 Xaa-Pro aminopeptidase family protein [Alteromonas mediterranea U8]